MIDIKLIRENKEVVKENIRNKFQDEKICLVDEVYDYDKEVRETQTKKDNLIAEKKRMSALIGTLMKEKNISEAEKVKSEIKK